jgi:hypothetical protein
MTVVVRRSAVKMWLLAIGSIPLLVISIDVVTRRRITDWLRGIVFVPADTQIYEPRDVIWAWALLIFSTVIVLWGLKELFLPTKVIECLDRGLALKLRGPFRPTDVVPWSDVVNVRSGRIEDDGERLPVLMVTVLARGGLPEHPWGARWVEGRVLGVLAQDWSQSPKYVADRISEFSAEVPVRKESESLETEQ